MAVGGRKCETIVYGLISMVIQYVLFSINIEIHNALSDKDCYVDVIFVRCDVFIIKCQLVVFHVIEGVR